jgi:hypothetical protein
VLMVSITEDVPLFVEELMDQGASVAATLGG